MYPAHGHGLCKNESNNFSSMEVKWGSEFSSYEIELRKMALPTRKFL